MRQTRNAVHASMFFYITVFLMYTMVFMTKQCFNAAMADIVNEGFMTKTETGIIIMVFYIVYAPGQIAGGFFADRFESSKLILIGLIGGIVSNAIIFFNHSYPVMLAAWGFNALAQFALWPAVLKIIATKLHIRHRFPAVAYITLAQPIGVILSYLIAALIGRWEYNFAISSMILLVATILFCGVYEYLKRKALLAEDEPTVGGKRTHAANTDKTRAVILGSGLLFVLLANLFKNMVIGGVRGLSPVMLMESYASVTPKIGNSLNMIILIFGIIGVLIAGQVNTRFRGKEFRISLVSWILTVPAWLVLVGIGKVNIWLSVLALSWIYGILMLEASTIQCWIASLQKYNCAGMAAGLSNAAASVGIVIQSYAFAAVADRTNWVCVVWLCTVLGILSFGFTVCAAVLWKRFKRIA